MSSDIPPSEEAALPFDNDPKVSETLGPLEEATPAVAALERLPPEILSDIFRQTLPHKYNLWAEYSYNLTLPTPPWRLALVNKRWRACALADARLWSSIHIVASIQEDEASIAACYPLAALEAQLLRSSDAPLDVVFDWGFHDKHPDHLRALLDMLVRESVRWETARITWDHRDLELVRTLAPLKGRLPLIRRFELFANLEPLLPADAVELCVVAPNLREVFLTDADYWYESHPIVAPWAQITRFRARLGLANHLEILRAAPNLIECGLVVLDSDEQIGLDLIVLPRLRRLYIDGNNLLDSLDAPNLEYLFFYGNAAPVLSLLSRSRPLLRGLTLQDPQSTPLIPLLEKVPTLEHLDLLFYRIPTAAINALFEALRVPGLCPKLVSLRVSLPFSQSTYDTLYPLLASRSAGALICARIHDSAGEIPKKTITRFQGLRSAGLDVLLMGSPSVVPEHPDPEEVKLQVEFQRPLDPKMNRL